MRRRDFFRMAAVAPLAVVPVGLALATPAECRHLFVAAWVGTPKTYEWPTPMCLHCGFRLPIQTTGVTVNDPGHTHTYTWTQIPESLAPGGYTNNG